MKLQETYILPDITVGNNLLAELGRIYPIKKQTGKRQHQTSYDSFDWRLLQKGFFLVEENGTRFELRNCETDECPFSTPCDGKQKPQFWWDFPKGRFRDKLEDILDVRALLPLAQTQRSMQTFLCLNDDHKTVLRLHLEDVGLVKDGGDTQTLRHALQVSSLRGYEKEVENLKAALDRLGVFPETRPRHFVMAALDALGKQPFDYSSKINIKLNPLMSAREAARMIHRQSLDVMRNNEEGMVADIDSEFLHDFRVACRRTRSALSLIKGVFPPAQVDQFKADFSYLGRLTNKMRDLDVYLLKRERYRGMVPEKLKPGLDLFFDDLTRERAQEYKKFVKGIRSARYKAIMKGWERFLESDTITKTGCPDCDTPVIHVARESIAKRFRKIYREGLAINDLTPEERLHELRIDFKKLRYQIEFFKSLFPAREIAFVVKRLRGLQGILGDLNDLHVQSERLNLYLSDISPQRKEAISLAASVGVLVASLQEEGKRVRAEFAQGFEQICDKKFVSTVEKHFGKKSVSPLNKQNP